MGLYLAGELLDVDGVTGGFNFQAAGAAAASGQAVAQHLLDLIKHAEHRQIHRQEN